MTRKRDLEQQIADLESALKVGAEHRRNLLKTLDRRNDTLATLYPEHAYDTSYGESLIDWVTLHATAEAVRRARQAEADAKTLKKWEG